MNLRQYYIEDEMTGDIWGKGPNGALRKCAEPKTAYAEGYGYYVEDGEQERHEKELDSLDGFDTIEEAEKAAEPLIRQKIPFLKIAAYTAWDETITYLQGRKQLTDAMGERPKEQKDK